MLKIGYAFFHPVHKIVEHHARELGVRYAVTNAGWTGPYNAWTHEWDYMPLLQAKLEMREYGMKFAVVEGVGFIDPAKLNLRDRDECIEKFGILLKNMADLGIDTVCYNWMPVWGWFRTQNHMVLPGGATATSFDINDVPKGLISDAGLVKNDNLWENLEYFLKRVVPMAEKYKVKLALHPDDPPVSAIGGIDRILTSADAMQRVIDLVPSEYNGITMCQGCFAAMGEDVPAAIRHFGDQHRIFFAHFRDIEGEREHFHETFHNQGKTDMLEAIRAYYDIGFDGVMRPDHVPTMYDDKVNEEGYGVNGNLFATGYMCGLMEAVEGERRQ